MASPCRVDLGLEAGDIFVDHFRATCHRVPNYPQLSLLLKGVNGRARRLKSLCGLSNRHHFLCLPILTASFSYIAYIVDTFYTIYTVNGITSKNNAECLTYVFTRFTILSAFTTPDCS